MILIIAQLVQISSSWTKTPKHANHVMALATTAMKEIVHPNVSTARISI